LGVYFPPYLIGFPQPTDNSMPSPPRPSNSPNTFKFLFGLFPLLLALSFSAFPKSTSAEETSREYILKAGFIYNFTKFIKWPDGIERSIKAKGITLCLVGEDPFGEILDRLSNKIEAKGKNLTIRRQPTKDALQSCHILFISQSEKSRLKEIIEKAERRPILLIGETPGYAQNGVMINFYIEGNRIKFEINKQALERRGLKVSSELLDLARIIEGND